MKGAERPPGLALGPDQTNQSERHHRFTGRICGVAAEKQGAQNGPSVDHRLGLETGQEELKHLLRKGHRGGSTTLSPPCRASKNSP